MVLQALQVLGSDHAQGDVGLEEFWPGALAIIADQGGTQLQITDLARVVHLGGLGRAQRQAKQQQQCNATFHGLTPVENAA
ncbi:hypothetical protein D3C77_429510 [compost metagenome]